MAVLKGMVQSAGLSRIYQHTQEQYCGTISAFRVYHQEFVEMSDKNKDRVDSTQYLIPYKENMKRHRMLGGILRAKGINTIEIEGVYKEAYMPKHEIEISYFCFADGDYIRDVLIELGDQFEQDSITYAEPKGTFELIVGHTHYEGGKLLKTGQAIRLCYKPNLNKETRNRQSDC